MSSNEIEELAEEYKVVFNSEQGKRVLEDLSRFTQFQTPSFNEQEDTSLGQMAFREGQRSVMARIMWMCELSRAEFQKQVRQAQAETETQE